mgnify:CR=1 FL=1
MNNMNPNVSIVVTNYNYGKYLPRCLRSVLSQKYIKTEVIVENYLFQKYHLKT